MSAMASQLTGVSMVCSAVCSGADKKKTSKPRVTGLCGGNSLVTGEFPSQRPVTRKMFPFDDVIMSYHDRNTHDNQRAVTDVPDR